MGPGRYAELPTQQPMWHLHGSLPIVPLTAFGVAFEVPRPGKVLRIADLCLQAAYSAQHAQTAQSNRTNEKRNPPSACPC
jgi:hypothetical protein